MHSPIQSFSHSSHSSIKDRKLRMWAIPILALITTILFTRENYWYTDFYLDVIAFTLGIFLIWEMNRWIILRTYWALPDRKDLKKRLIIQLAISIPLSMILAIGMFVLHINLILQKPILTVEFITKSMELLLPALMITLCLNAFYENFFLNQLWQASVIEAEQYKKSNLEARFRNLKEQVNPHFLFNSFNTIATLIEEHPQRAIAFVEKLSEVYRYVLNSKDKEIVPLATELDFAQSYIFLLKMRFEDSLQAEIDIAPEYLQSYHIPPLTLQMLIENAIKHNEIRKNQPLAIAIRIENQQIVVRNSLQKKWNPRSNGLGLENIKQRYQFLTQASVVIQETVDAFIVKLPLLSIQPS